MIRAAQASFIALPQISQPPATVFDYFCYRFDNVPASVWRERFTQGKVHWQDGQLLDLTTPYRPQQKVYYYREVANETLPPFEESILYEDELIVLANNLFFLYVFWELVGLSSYLLIGFFFHKHSAAPVTVVATWLPEQSSRLTVTPPIPGSLASWIPSAFRSSHT